ncbi:SsrA-binding protein SmpB [Candidatus Kaiserbacteria bacterium]|nr:SsrA-binding protein SmpB [Candidatus Kaiserbacteria bacterium]
MTLVSHKRASFDFEILDTFEAGISLLGTEVKSVRNHQGKLEGSHVVIRGGEAFLLGVSIPAFQKANAPKDYDPERTRKLLLSKKEIDLLDQKSNQAGLTIVPTKLYNAGRNIKVEIALVRGKKKHDKREVIKKRDTERDIARSLKM